MRRNRGIAQPAIRVEEGQSRAIGILAAESEAAVTGDRAVGAQCRILRAAGKRSIPIERVLKRLYTVFEPVMACEGEQVGERKRAA